MSANPSSPPTLKRLRKRDADRRFQRNNRERTKSRLQFLESLAEQLRQQDANGCIDVLMRKLTETEEQRDAYKRKVESIEVILGTSLPKNDPSLSQKGEPTSADANNDISGCKTSDSPDELGLTGQIESIASPSFVHKSVKGKSPLDNNAKSLLPDISTENIVSPNSLNVEPTTTTKSPPVYSSCDCQRQSRSLSSRRLNKWKTVNERLCDWMKSPTVYQLDGSLEDQELWHDTPIRGIVEGWSAVERRGSFHPAWRLLRTIDEIIFEQICSKTERLAVMFIMGTLLAAHLNPNSTNIISNVPTYYLKHVMPPTQSPPLHSYAIDYLAWPGVRAKFEASEHRYCANKFWDLLALGLKVQWPYSLRDCYLEKTDSGLYSLSSTFYTTIMDIQSWTMGPDLFQVFPELRADIPAHNSIPGSLQTNVHFTYDPTRSQKQPPRRLLNSGESVSETIDIDGVDPTIEESDKGSSQSRDEPMMYDIHSWRQNSDYMGLFQSDTIPGYFVDCSSGIDGLMSLIGGA